MVSSLPERTRFPCHDALNLALAKIFFPDERDCGWPRIVSREANVHGSTFPSEIVQCRFQDGSELSIFCKYSGQGEHNAHGHRGGVDYEAQVYDRVLAPYQISTPRFLGAHTDRVTSTTSLMLEYLPDGQRFTRSADVYRLVVQIARWLGQFHKTCAALQDVAHPFLNFHDREYYAGWARRTLLFSEAIPEQHVWLPTLCARFQDQLAEILAIPNTIIHGEFYPKNVLYQDGIIYPVDWESAAITVGEIDLASLIDGWPVQVAAECELAYVQERWPQGKPAHFDRTLAAARLYWMFRWLGDRQKWTTHARLRRRFEELRLTGEHLGLV